MDSGTKIFKWVDSMKISQFNEDFLKIFNEDSDTGYFVEADVQYPENLHDLHNVLLFLPERMKIEKI